MKHNFPYDKALEYFKSSVDGKGLDHRHLALAIQALEKQIPRKVFEIENCSVHCPKCSYRFRPDNLGHVFVTKFCPVCGQAIERKGVAAR